MSLSQRPERRENTIGNWVPRYQVRLLEMGFDVDKIRGQVAKEGYYVLKKFFDSQRRGYVTEGCNAMVESMIRESDSSGEINTEGKRFAEMYNQYSENKATPAPITFTKETHTDDLFDLFFDSLLIDVATAFCGSDEIRLLPGYRIHAATTDTVTGPWHQEYIQGLDRNADPHPAELQAALGRTAGGKFGGMVCQMQMSGQATDGACVQVIKGSHELGPLTHTIKQEYPAPVTSQQIDVAITNKYNEEIISISLEPGDVLVQHMFLVKRDVGKRRWCAQWAYQDGLKDAVLFNGVEGFYARSPIDMDREVQTPDEWGAHSYVGNTDA